MPALGGGLIGTAKVGFVGDTSGLDRSIVSAKKSVEGFGASAERAMSGSDRMFLETGQSVQVMGSKIDTATTAVSGFIAAWAGYQGISMVVSEIGKATKAASDLQETTNKFGVVFSGMQGQASAWASELQNAYGLSKQASMDSLSGLQVLTTGMGMAKGEAGKLSTDIIKLAVDMGSLYNISTADALDAFRSAIIGEYDPIQKFAGAVTAAKVEEEALALGLAKTTKEITAADKAQALYSLVLKANGVAVGDWARNQNTLATQMKLFDKNIDDIQASLGQALLPAITTIAIQTNEWLQRQMALKNSGMPNFFDAVGVSLNVIAGVITGVSSAFGQLSNILSSLPTVKSGFLGVEDYGAVNEFSGAVNSAADNVKRFKINADGTSQSIDAIATSSTNATPKVVKTSTSVDHLATSTNKAAKETNYLAGAMETALAFNSVGYSKYSDELQSMAEYTKITAEEMAKLESELLNLSPGFDALSGAIDKNTQDQLDNYNASEALSKALGDKAGLLEANTQMERDHADAIRDGLLATNDFTNGLVVGFNDALEAERTWAETGLDLFEEFTDGLTDAGGASIYYALKGDFDNIGDAWEGLLDDMLKWAADTIADIILQWSMSQIFKWLGGDSTVSITDPPGLGANTTATTANTSAIEGLTAAISGANFSGGGASPGAGSGGAYGNGSPGTGAYGSGYAGYAGDGQTYGSLGMGNPKSYGGGSAPGATSPGGFSNISTSQWLGAVASLYGAYQAWTGGGNAIGKGLSTGSAAMNMYGLYKSYMGQGMSPLMQGVGGVMGTVGGAYGLYNSLKNKDYVGSAMNAYSLYNSAKGLYGLYQAYNAGSIGLGSGAGATTGAIGSGVGTGAGSGASAGASGAWGAAGSGLGAGLAGAGAIAAMAAQAMWQAGKSHNYGARLGGGSASFGQNGWQMNTGFGAISGDDSFGNKQADKINTALNGVFGQINAQLGGMVDIVGGDAMANIAKALSGQGAISVTSKLDQFLNTDQGKQYKSADDALMAYIRQNPMMAMGAGGMQSDEYLRLSKIRADLLKGSGLTQEDMSGFGVKSGSKNNYGAQNIVDQTIRTTFETTGLALAEEDAATFGSKLEALGFVAGTNGWESDATVGMAVGMAQGFEGDIASQMELLGFTGTMGGWESEATVEMVAAMSDQGVPWETIEQTIRDLGGGDEIIKTLRGVYTGSDPSISTPDQFSIFSMMDPPDTATMKSLNFDFNSSDAKIQDWDAAKSAVDHVGIDHTADKIIDSSVRGFTTSWPFLQDALDYEGKDDTTTKTIRTIYDTVGKPPEMSQSKSSERSGAYPMSIASGARITIPISVIMDGKVIVRQSVDATLSELMKRSAMKRIVINANGVGR